jgi:hypothetical protein
MQQPVLGIGFGMNNHRIHWWLGTGFFDRERNVSTTKKVGYIIVMPKKIVSLKI